MRIKPFVLAGLFGAVLTSSAITSISYAQKHDDLSPAPIVIAQAEKQGFFDKLFNRSKSGTDTKPLYLDGTENEGNRSLGGLKTIKPFDFSKQTRGGGLKGRKELSLIEQQVADRNAKLAEERQRLSTLTAAMNNEIESMMDKKVSQRSEKSAAVSKQKKVQVYDPNKAKDYDPNSKARLYNSQR